MKGGGVRWPWRSWELLNHAALVIGYDDDDAAGTWHCQNSFGTGWGDQGFFRLRYGSGMLLADDLHPAFKVV